MSEPRAVFLGRRSYAGRRRRDAARLLPLFGLSAMILPALIAVEASMAATLLYFFGAWTLLVCAAALLARRLGDERAEEDEEAR